MASKAPKKPKIVARVGEKLRPNIGRLAATLVLTIVIGEVYLLTAPHPVTTKDACPLPDRVDNRSIAPHWPDVRQWCSLIAGAGETYGLDPHLIAALILMESGGNPGAYSRSGAVGLMQVMPRDGIAAEFQCRSGPCFANRPTISELQDPAFNVDYGSRLLADNVERTGSVREALRSYGPLNVEYRYADSVLTIYDELKE